MGTLRRVFGPSRKEIWRQLSSEIDARYVDGGFWKGDTVQAAHDEWTVTLDTYAVSTGKATIVPMVLIETDQTPYWRKWDAFVRDTLAAQGLIDPVDTTFYRVVDTVDAAVRELTQFYRVYHSSRIVGDNLVFRLNRALRDTDLAAIQQRFEDVLKGPLDQAPGPVPQEHDEYPDLPRLLVPFNRSSYARLRQLIDFVNTF